MLCTEEYEVRILVVSRLGDIDNAGTSTGTVTVLYKLPVVASNYLLSPACNYVHGAYGIAYIYHIIMMYTFCA